MIIKFWFRLIILGIFFEQHTRFIVKDLLRKLVITYIAAAVVAAPGPWKAW